MPWRLAVSLETLRAEVNARWPNRSKASDGTIGDAAHAETASDHNPNPEGVVCAFDITQDPANGPDCDQLFAELTARRHPDCKYLIWDRQIVRAYDKPGIPAWTPSPYTGADPHTNHIHVSVGVGPDGHSAPGTYDHNSSWLDAVPLSPDVVAPPTPAPQLSKDDDMGKLLRFQGHNTGDKAADERADKTDYFITGIGHRKVTSEADRDFLRLIGLADGKPGDDVEVQPIEREDAALAGIDFDRLRPPSK